MIPREECSRRGLTFRALSIRATKIETIQTAAYRSSETRVDVSLLVSHGLKEYLTLTADVCMLLLTRRRGALDS